MAPMTNDDDEDLSRYSNNHQNSCDYYVQFHQNSLRRNSYTINSKTSSNVDININHNQSNPSTQQQQQLPDKGNTSDHCVDNQRLCLTESTKNPTSKSKIFDPSSRPVAKYGTTDKRGEIARYQTNPGGDQDPEDGSKLVGVTDIIGSFGWFQLLLLVFSGLREGLVGYDALIMSIILQPESEFLCLDNLRASQELDSSLVSRRGSMNLANISALLSSRHGDWQAQLNETAQCYRSLDGGQSYILDPATNEPLRCTSWVFPNETIATSGPSLVAEWSLVCQYHWLVAFIESAYFFGLVTGNLVWGYYADKVGRRPAYLAAHTISLIFGSLAVVSPTIYTFAVCRFLSAFGAVGYNIIYSIQVELIGTKQRSFSTILNHLGWGLGVICVPLVDRLFDDYRPIIAVAPVLTLLMFPWAFWLPESSRWLMANGKFKEARAELIRAAHFNGRRVSWELDKKIASLEQRARADKQQQQVSSKKLIIGNEQYYDGHASDGVTGRPSKQRQAQVCSYRLIFSNKKLVRDTLILSYVAFLGHLFYYVQTINFAYVKNLSVAANFITSGAGEWVSVIAGAILLKLFSRKTCMALFLFLMTCSFTFQSLIDSELMPELDTEFTITANNCLGTLASLLLVFVILIVNQEVYPTVVRQTGTSITNTLGESGSTLAPLVIQLSRIIGSWRANGIYSVLCIIGILASQFLTKTDDIELPDT